MELCDHRDLYYLYLGIHPYSNFVHQTTDLDYALGKMPPELRHIHSLDQTTVDSTSTDCRSRDHHENHLNLLHYKFAAAVADSTSPPKFSASIICLFGSAIAVAVVVALDEDSCRLLKVVAAGLRVAGESLAVAAH